MPFGATQTPECFLFNKFGRLVYRGSIDDCPQNDQEVTQQFVKQAITLDSLRFTGNCSGDIGLRMPHSGEIMIIFPILLQNPESDSHEKNS